MATNINQYRSDTASAVGRILRPGRTLGGKRTALVEALRKGGPGRVAFTVARGNEECLKFHNEIVAAFTEAGWKRGRSQFPFIIKDAVGLQMSIKTTNESEFSGAQMTVAMAFKSIDMQLMGGVQPALKDGPVEIYVVLQ